ncbi:MAG: VacJ family lipoprotein [Desulfovibrio sp.]
MNFSQLKTLIASVILASLVLSTPVFAQDMVEAKYADDAVQSQFLDDEVWDDQGNLIPEGGEVASSHADNDPFEGWNRFWFSFNDYLITGVINPFSTGYKAVVPERPRMWIDNFFNNLFFPIRFVNNLLQGEVEGAGVELSRFVGNTAFGLGGLGNPTEDNAPVHKVGNTDEDTGLTLGHWGFGSGPYLVWPVLGSSSVRDSIGLIGDTYLSPLTYMNPWYYSLGAKGFYRLQQFSFHMDDYADMKAASLDPYLTFKDVYLNYRVNRVNEKPTEFVPIKKR